MDSTICWQQAERRRRWRERAAEFRKTPKRQGYLKKYYAVHRQQMIERSKSYVQQHAKTALCCCGRVFRVWNGKHVLLCRQCRASVGETMTRKLFEGLFGSPFPTVHPEWLKTGAARPLELDGYNETLGIAFEYQGPAHFEPIYGQKKLDYRQHCDQIKRQRCAERGVALLEIGHQICFDELKPRVLELCAEKEILVPRPDFL